MTPLDQRQMGRDFGQITSLAACTPRRRFLDGCAASDATLREQAETLEGMLTEATEK